MVTLIGNHAQAYGLRVRKTFPPQMHVYTPQVMLTYSLSLQLSKVSEHIIFEKICDHLTVSDRQWGFLAGRSTIGAILSAMHEWHLNLERGAEIQTVFFDLQKAFDSVPHSYSFKSLSSLMYIPTLLLGLAVTFTTALRSWE